MTPLQLQQQAQAYIYASKHVISLLYTHRVCEMLVMETTGRIYWKEILGLLPLIPRTKRHL
jgi:hypothetical protein